MDTAYLEEDLELLKEKGLYRYLRVLESSPAPEALLDGKQVLLFSSNNYLGLSTHPKVIEAAKAALLRYGTGSGASRLISGNFSLYTTLEEKLARLKQTEAAVVFSSGYAANLGAIQSLVGTADLIVIDKLNHACLIDGARLSGARMRSYPHGDLAYLEKVLQSEATAGRRLIATDGVFSMDGDIVPLQEILVVARRHNASILLDDAHATGVLGTRGGGTCEFLRIQDDAVIQMGTLSKALGGLGGFICGSRTLIEYLVNHARTLVYSTALPPSVLAGAIAALEVLETEPSLREALWKNVEILRRGLSGIGYNLMKSSTHILPILLGENELAVRFSKGLLKEGLFIPAIRTPTVPKGTARLRLTVMATHTEAHLDKALQAFHKVGRQVGVIS